MKAPPSKQRHLIEGYFDGDGTHSGRTSRMRVACTASKTLAHQIYAILLRLKFIPTLSKVQNKERKIGTRILKETVRYTISYYENPAYSKTGFIVNNILYTPIRKVKLLSPLPTIGLTVAGERTYTLHTGYACHNTSGITVGYQYTDQMRIGSDDGMVYFRAMFPAVAIPGGDSLPLASEDQHGNKIVYVNARINPKDVDPASWQNWAQRLSSNAFVARPAAQQPHLSQQRSTEELAEEETREERPQ